MLEDRKFFFPVTSDYQPWGYSSDPYSKAGEFRYLAASPWKVVTPGVLSSENVVEMDTSRAFAGEHCVAIHCSPGLGSVGISQDGISVESGRRYCGSIVMAQSGSINLVEIKLGLSDESLVIRTIDSTGDESLHDDSLGENSLSKDVLGGDFQTVQFEFEATATTDNARLEIGATGSGTLRVGAVSLMPANNLGGWRADVIKLLRELDAPIYRWPGGNFVSGYNWRDGIGPRDGRPPRMNPAWKGIEHNDVGIHEFMQLMALIDSEAFIAVNTGLGTVEEVADEVAYLNAPFNPSPSALQPRDDGNKPDTHPMALLRAQNGQDEPWGVTWWAVGNEMYGSHQLGHIPVADYVDKHIAVAEAMRAIDPTVKLVGVGETGTFPIGVEIQEDWNKVMLTKAANHMDLISEHIYAQDDPDVVKHAHLLASMIDGKAAAHRRYLDEMPGLKERKIRVAMDEWNHWYGDYLYGELGVRYFMKDALGIAIGLHAFFRHSDLYYMANYAQTVNVIGAIKTSPTHASFAATGLPLKMYRQHFGQIPVEVELLERTGPGSTIPATSSNEAQTKLDPPKQDPPNDDPTNGAGMADDQTEVRVPRTLDIAAALTGDRSVLTVSIVNVDSEEHKVELRCPAINHRNSGTVWSISDDDPNAFNVPGQTPSLYITESAIDPADDKSGANRKNVLTVAPFSINIVRLPFSL